VAVTVSTDTTEHSDIAVVVAAGLTGSLIEALRRRRQQLEQAGAPAPPPDLTTLPAYGALSPTARAAYDRLVTTDDLDLLRLALARLRARAGDR
jgi:hypothetical protein